MLVTYEEAERFMLDYFTAYSQKAQTAQTQSCMDRFYAPDLSFDNPGIQSRQAWYKACLSHPLILDVITPERMCIDVRKLTVSAEVKSHFIEKASGKVLLEIGMNAFYTLNVTRENDLAISRIDVFLESDPAKAARMMEILRDQK